MNSAQAKELYDKSVKKTLDDEIMNEVYKEIKKLITEAKRKDYDFDYLLNAITLSDKKSIRGYKDDIKKELIKQGYKFDHFPDPDYGHPCSRDYEMIYFF